MSDDSSTVRRSGGGLLSTFVSAVCMYIALYQGRFLAYAGGLTSPWDGLGVLLVWVATVVGVFNWFLAGIVMIALIFLVLAALFKAYVEVQERVGGSSL